MVDKCYDVAFEVAGPAAMWGRPDTGGTPTSYVAPTWSAAKGLFESIAFFADGAAWICPTKVELCRAKSENLEERTGGKFRFQRYTTNYGGPLRKGSIMKKGVAAGGSNMQVFATILTDVCYRLYGTIVGPPWRGRVNPRHHLSDLFNRRLRRGQCFRTPCLGWSEFTCSYWGPFREDRTEVDKSLSEAIPSMLVAVWNRPAQGTHEPFFAHDVQITEGTLQYQVPEEWLTVPATKGHPNAE